MRGRKAAHARWHSAGDEPLEFDDGYVTRRKYQAGLDYWRSTQAEHMRRREAAQEPPLDPRRHLPKDQAPLTLAEHEQAEKIAAWLQLSETQRLQKKLDYLGKLHYGLLDT